MTKEQIFALQPSRKIIFSKNCNKKLYCHYYTTIRKSSAYYVPGEYYFVFQARHAAADHRALLITKKTILLEQLPEITAYLDTGMNQHQTKELFRRMYPQADWNTQKLDILLLQNLEADLL